METSNHNLINGLSNSSQNTELAFKCFGVVIKITINQSNIIEDILKILPPGAVVLKNAATPHVFQLLVDKSSHGQMSVFKGLNLLGARRFLPEALILLESNIRLTIAEFACQYVFVHAGVVVWKDRAIIFPGYSYAGKSTLTKALIETGCLYYSDEYAVLDKSGRVSPFAKPLSIREEGGAFNYTIEEIGGSKGDKPAAVALVLLTEYQSGSIWQPQEISAGEGSLEVLAHTISAQRNPATALKFLNQASSNAKFIKSVRGEADQTAREILKWIESSAID